MLNRKRSYVDLVGTFLLWVEEVADNPPWTGNILRRPWKLVFDTPDGPREHTTRPWQDRFVARSETIAKDAAFTTIRNCFPDYAQNLERVDWIESQVSDEEWEKACNRFIQGKEFKLA